MRPKLFAALPRTRLLSLLDEAARRSIVWICGAPSAGKTTLVESYRTRGGYVTPGIGVRCRR
jgi:predicted ATPase